jgi:thiol-disulfide isomerase/thioredoxin
MVDWDRVDELRSKGWDWDRIADDPKVAFHADAAMGRPGRALRALYHRTRRDARRAPDRPPSSNRPSRTGPGWSLMRGGYLAVPFAGIWFLLAYVAPSPVGLILPALPWIGLILAVAAFVLLFALWRTTGGKRWTPVFRTTLISGIVLGLIFSGAVALVGAFVFGCPYLPPSSSLSATPAPDWKTGSMPLWTEGGKPVVYFYGASWCPYCSASSWSIWKALTEFGTVSGAVPGYSFAGAEVYPHTPEIILANATLNSPSIAFQVTEYNGPTDGVTLGTSSCVQQGYLVAYSGGSIPFVVVGGKYVHGGATLNNPKAFENYTSINDSNGAPTVEMQVRNETGQGWTGAQAQAWWIMAMLVKELNEPVSTLAADVTPHWSPSTVANVTADLNLL